MKFSVCVPGKAENHTIVKMKKPAGIDWRKYLKIISPNEWVTFFLA